MAAPEEGDSIAATPTWAVAAVCSVLMLAALLAEHALHLLTALLQRRRRKTLTQAIYHVKAELRSFGFMSLILNVAQQPISKICISETLAGTFLPCKLEADHHDLPGISSPEDGSSCPEGRVPLLSSKGTEQLLLFIIMLAVSHVLSCLLTFGFGTIKMRRWESWEEETRTLEYQLSTDPRRFKLTRETSFGRRHLKIRNFDHPLLLWLTCFFRQFKTSVSKADYLALRHGFIAGYFPQDQSYDFHKFLRRSLDQDFSLVVGISQWSWTYAILFIFFNAQGFYSYFWLPVVPLVMLLIVGTKLEVAITRMCLEGSSELGSVVPGTLRVRPNNNYFWVGQPRFILQIIHFILFQNAFQVAFFIWTWYKFGFPSCFHRETEDMTLSIGIGGLVQILCAYVTLPLHVLVTRVGSSKTEIIFTEEIIRGLRNWRRAARKNLQATPSRTSDAGSRHSTVSTSPERPAEPSHGVVPAADPPPSPLHLHAEEPVEILEQPCDLPPPTCCRLPVQEIMEETSPTGGEAVVVVVVPAVGEELQRAGEETTAAAAPTPVDVNGEGASYDGEVSFGIWQLQLQPVQDCEISEHPATSETVEGPYVEAVCS